MESLIENIVLVHLQKALDSVDEPEISVDLLKYGFQRWTKSLDHFINEDLFNLENSIDQIEISNYQKVSELLTNQSQKVQQSRTTFEEEVFLNEGAALRLSFLTNCIVIERKAIEILSKNDPKVPTEYSFDSSLIENQIDQAKFLLKSAGNFEYAKPDVSAFKGAVEIGILRKLRKLLPKGLYKPIQGSSRRFSDDNIRMKFIFSILRKLSFQDLNAFQQRLAGTLDKLI
jgi:hypothetical protein